MNNDASKVNYLAVIVAVVAAALVSSVWYSPFLFGKQWMELRDAANQAAVADTTIPAWKMIVEIVREFVVAYVIARFVTRTRTADWKGGLSLGFWVWLGFPVAMLVGASLWDNKPWMLVPIHAGDWLMKMLLMALIFSKWPRSWANRSQKATA